MRRHFFLILAIPVLTACGGATDDEVTPPRTEVEACFSDSGFSPKVEPIFYKLQEWADARQQAPIRSEAPRVSALAKSNNYVTPTRKLSESEWPSFNDDLNFESMELALERQLRRYSQRDLSRGTIKFGNQKYALKDMKVSLEKFKILVSDYLQCLKVNGLTKKAACLVEFNQGVRLGFDVFAPDLNPRDPRYGEKNATLFTAYYTPTLDASSAVSPVHPYPIYGRPPEHLRKLSRREIDFNGALAGHGLELFFTSSLFELYLLHVQGGGKAQVLRNGIPYGDHYLTYDGTNEQSWSFISKYMIEKGYIPHGSIEAQRDYLERNPHKREEIFSTCPSYVYFKITDEPPHGSDMVPLTDNRSIATDTAYYRFKGALAYVEARRPANPYDPEEACDAGQFKNFSRFYLDQDTGGAIRGKARVDLYFGESKYAEVAAYNTIERGELYFLMVKK